MGLCLLAFWASLLLPRVDGQLVGSDGLHYYIYLPSVVLDGDLDFEDEYAHFLAYNPRHLAYFESYRNAQGVLVNDWGIGPALLWLPFFLLAHVLAVLLHGLGFAVDTQGYSHLYQAIVLSGSILYGGAGMLLAYKVAARWASERAALVAAILVVFAGNLVYYLTAEPSMSHAPSAFLSGLFVYTWLARRGKENLKTAALLGLLGGLMALVRPQDGLLLVLPFLDRLPGIWRAWRAERQLGGVGLLVRDGLVAAAVAFLVFSPQWMLWDFFYGDGGQPVEVLADDDSAGAEAAPQWQDESAFNWSDPKLGRVLFSAHRGLFIWHPIFLLALVGLLFNRKHSWLGGLCLFGFAVQWYLVSSWYGWTQGDAFGGRMFIVCTPFFVLGLAWLLDRAVRPLSWKAVYLVGAVLLLWNFLLFVEYRFELALAPQPPTWEDVTVGRITFFFEYLFE